jgi:cell cycle arrest protein BUB3
LQNIHLYDGLSGSKQALLPHGAPVLDATFDTHATSIYSGGLDNTIKKTDLATASSVVVGTHDAAVKCVEWLPSRNLLASAGWDNALKLWDPRSNPNSGPVSSITLPGKAFSMSTSSTTTEARLVVATSNRNVEVYEIRTLGTPEQQHTSRESPLKFQTRCVRCFPTATGDGFAISSVEGRVGIEYYDPSEQIQAKKYAFKCHRKTLNSKDVVYPVNSIAFNAVHGTFCTGGCDGIINFWDGSHKKRLHQVQGYPTSIAALAFNNDASVLAVAASYTFERGEIEHPPPDAIYLRKVAPIEILPRQKTTTATGAA